MLALVQDAWWTGKTVVSWHVRTGRTTTLWHYYGMLIGVSSEDQGRPIGRQLDGIRWPVLLWMLHSVKSGARLVVPLTDGRMLPRFPLDVESSSTP